MPTIAEFHHVHVPVSDVLTSRDWYSAVLGFAPLLDFEEEDELVGVALCHPAGITIWISHDPDRAAVMRGFDIVSLSVADRPQLDEWLVHLDALGIEHTPVTGGHPGWTMDVMDPDGIHVRFRTPEQPSTG